MVGVKGMDELAPASCLLAVADSTTNLVADIGVTAMDNQMPLGSVIRRSTEELATDFLLR